MKRTLACPKLAFKWVIGFAARLAFLIACIACAIIFAPPIWSVTACIILGVTFILTEYISIKRCGYGFSLFRCFTVVKIEEDGIYNRFCKIKFENACYISYEHIYADHTNSRRYIRGDFGVVALISAKSDEKKKSFSEYSAKDTICLPLTEEVKQLIESRFKANV